MFSVGILAFIFMDVTKHGEAILETAVSQFKAQTVGFGHVLGLFALLAAGFTIGTAGISALERTLHRRRIRLRLCLRSRAATPPRSSTRSRSHAPSRPPRTCAASGRCRPGW